MRRVELSYNYPPELVATEPRADFRTLFSAPGQPPQEISRAQLNERLQPGDLLVINDTRVEPRRVFCQGVEVLFLEALSPKEWIVLFPAREFSLGAKLVLPSGQEATLSAKGLPQRILLHDDLPADFFDRYGEPALPPYIQKARGERHARNEDRNWYQSDWAERAGSSAAPTASLHFRREDLQDWQNRGVEVERITLHVGLGTFLPVKAEDLSQHKMHHEPVTVPETTRAALDRAQQRGARVWALGTTVTRALEAMAKGHFQEDATGALSGETDLFIQPGFDWRVVTGLMTNFHQPESTLLALVASFAGLDRVKEAYAFAIDKRFRLFSYGDFSVWTR